MNRRRTNPTTNSGAIADVSFLLLIFFMVVTTFNKDYKLAMTLPPYSEESRPAPISKDRIIQVLINAENKILINDDFINGDGIEIITDYLDGIIKKKLEPLIIIKMHPSTDYQAYIELLAQINASKNNMRVILADKIYTKEYAGLGRKEQKHIEQKLKIHISEQELIL